jgi:hypothetical protein
MAERISDVEEAERLVRRRARMLLLLVILFLSWQGDYFLADGALGRTVDHVKVSAWLVWAIALLAILATGGGYFRSRAVRALMDDDTTRHHRLTAFSFGFWASVGAAILVYALSMFATVSGREASHLIISAAVGASLLSFVWLERRALGAA